MPAMVGEPLDEEIGSGLGVSYNRTWQEMGDTGERKYEIQHHLAGATNYSRQDRELNSLIAVTNHCLPLQPMALSPTPSSLFPNPQSRQFMD